MDDIIYKLKSVMTATNYTIYVPDNPTKMAVYIHARMDFPHSKGRKGRTLYNFQEEVAEGIFNANPNTIVVVARYDKKTPTAVIELINSYKIKDVTISGWSLGGNDAVTLLTEIYKKTDICPTLLLIDSNHTNQFSDKVFQQVKTSKVFYISNTLSKAKSSHISKIIKNGMSVTYLLLTIPKGFSGSNHRYCRDSTINNNVYGFIFGGKLKGDYKIGIWDAKKGEFVV